MEDYVVFVESRALTHLKSIGAGKRDFHVHGWASGPWELKTPPRISGDNAQVPWSPRPFRVIKILRQPSFVSD